MYAGLGLLSVVLTPAAKTKYDEEDPRHISFRDVFTDKIVYMILGVCFLATIFPMYMTSAFKIFGSTQKISDELLSIAGSVGSVFNCISSFAWA